jgi:type IX secretion system PorP/SprF family membrane protein
LKSKLANRILALLLLLLALNVNSQDIHFSQFASSPLNLNPALTGFFQGNNRFILNHRNQWASVTTPYSTFSGSFDMPLIRRKYIQDLVGIGLVINNDVAGDSKMGTTEASLALSYIKALNKRNNHLISVGIEAGFAQHKIDYDKLYFDNQFNGNYYDPSLATGEKFTKNSFTYMDFSAGVNWFLQTDDRVTFTLGFALFHINKPKLSFFENSDVILNNKMVFYGNSSFPVANSIDLIPSLLFMKQANYTELTYGATLKFIMESNPFYYSALNFGTFIRQSDAAIVSAGLDMRKTSIGISYDFNFSDLHPASRYFGGYEISLIYIISYQSQHKIKEIKCPIF